MVRWKRWPCAQAALDERAQVGGVRSRALVLALRGGSFEAQPRAQGRTGILPLSETEAGRQWIGGLMD